MKIYKFLQHDEWSVRRLAGHATEAMQRRYTHLDADDAGDAAEAIGKFW